MISTRRLSALLIVSLNVAVASTQDLRPGPGDFQVYRDRLAALIPDGVAVLEGSEFAWLTGAGPGDAKLILVPASVALKTKRPEAWATTIYLPPKSPQAGIWDDPRLSYGDDAGAVTGIARSAPAAEFLSDIAKLGSIVDNVYVPFRGLPGQEEPGSPGLRLRETVSRLLPGIRIRNLNPVLAEIRWAKTQVEIQVMSRSCAVTVEAFLEAARSVRPGLFEYEVEAVSSYVMRLRGAQPTFKIIGSGPNSCVLHHMDNDRRMLSGELLVIDIGNTWNGLGTDLTRTVPVSGTFTAEQKKVYAVVLEAQKKAIALVRPGVTLAEVHRAAFEVIDKAGYGKNFIHGTSHSLNGGSGLAYIPPGQEGLFVPVKEKGRYAGNDAPVVEGTMFTIEPGIYIPERSLGVRIEDSVLVTREGCEILTRGAPKEIAEIEKLMKEAPGLVRRER